MTKALTDIDLLSDIARCLGDPGDRSASLAESLREFFGGPDATRDPGLLPEEGWLNLAADDEDPTLEQHIRPMVQGPDTVAAAAETPSNIPAPPARALPALELHYSDMLDALPHAVVEINGLGRVGAWNRAAERLFGWAADEVLGGPPPFLPPERLTDHQRMLCQCRAGAAVREGVTAYRTKAGAPVRAVASAAPHAGGGVVFQFRPWGELERPDELFGASKAPADRRLETLGRLVAAAAQDFRRVVAAVRDHAKHLAEQLTVLDDRREFALNIQAAAARGEAVTRRLLNLAAPTPGPAEAVDVSAVLAEMAGLLKAVAGDGVRLRVRPGANTDLVVADPSLIEQTVLNLVANARDAVGAGGSIGVRTVRTVHAGRRCVLVTVADTGANGAAQTPLLEAFSSPRPGGSATGLSAVREAVAKAGGRLEYDTDPDRGTVVRAYFPAVPEAANAETDPDPLPPKGYGKTVLLVEPDAAARWQHRKALEAAGCNVIETANGEDALRLSRAILPPLDVLVTELALNRLTGRALAEQLRQDRPRLRVVYVSQRPDAVPDPHGSFVPKPCRPDQLVAGVRAAGMTAMRGRSPVATN